MAEVKILNAFKLDYEKVSGKKYVPPGQADKKDKKPKQEQKVNLEKQKAKEAKKAAKKAKAAEHKAKENKQSGNDKNNNQKQKQQVVDDGSDCAEGKYGKLPLIQSKEYFDRELLDVITLNSKMAGKDIWVRARVHNVRIQSAKLGFINLRQQQSSIQCVLAADGKTCSKQMIEFVNNINRESLVDIRATIKKSPEPIKSTTQQ